MFLAGSIILLIIELSPKGMENFTVGIQSLLIFFSVSVLQNMLISNYFLIPLILGPLCFKMFAQDTCYIILLVLSNMF